MEASFLLCLIILAALFLLQKYINVSVYTPGAITKSAKNGF